jgi:hypothetical protein
VLDVRAHPTFKRDGADIHYELPISFPQAALGDAVEVPTIDGTEKLTIPPGTQSGKVLRLRDRGVPRLRGMGRGDQYITVLVRTPTQLSAQERELYQELAWLATHDGGNQERNDHHKARILEYLRATVDGADDDQLATALDISPRQLVNTICRKLEKAGLITRRQQPGSDKIINVLAEAGRAAAGAGEHKGFLGKMKDSLGI